MELDPEEYKFLQQYAKDACGLIIPDNKDYLLTFRLEPIIEAHGLSGYKELCENLNANHKNLREEVITVLTTHETFFFRDRHPFEAFSKVILPNLERRIVERKKATYIRKGPKVNIWSAACSTGQEPYSLAMLIHNSAITSAFNPEDISIVATDVSSETLSQAMRATYRKFEVERGLTGETNEAFITRYFKPSGNDFEIIDDIKRMVEIKFCNLMEPFEHLGGFDLIFCRNVLIYFNEESKNKIIQQFHNMLSPNGFLILGSSETLNEKNHLFKAINENSSLVYEKVDQ